MTDTFKFDRDFDTGRVLAADVGRLVLGKNHSVRLKLLPDGLHLFYQDYSLDKQRLGGDI